MYGAGTPPLAPFPSHKRRGRGNVEKLARKHVGTPSRHSARVRDVPNNKTGVCPTPLHDVDE
jgi:hypothetical protein